MTDEEKTYSRISALVEEAARILSLLRTISRPVDFSIDFSDDFNSRRMAL